MLVCKAGTQGGNETQKERWGGGEPVIMTDRESSESGRRGGREEDRSHPIMVGVKKSKASQASKVDDEGRLF